MNELIPTNEKERKELSFLLTILFAAIGFFKRYGDTAPVQIVKDARVVATEVTAFSKELE